MTARLREFDILVVGILGLGIGAIGGYALGFFAAFELWGPK